MQTTSPARTTPALIALVFAPLVLLATSGLPVLAVETSGLVQATPVPVRRQPRRAVPHAALETPVQLPAVPKYTGTAHYLNGYQAIVGTDCRIIGMNYCTKEDEAAVIEWYRQSLATSGWTVKPAQEGIHVCLATYGDGSVLQITTSAASENGYRANCHFWFRTR